MRNAPLLCCLAAACVLTGCQVASTPPEVVARHQQIQAEASGDYWIGRRVASQRTRYWGYIRRPRQLWENAQLVVFNERQKLAPDRYSEIPTGAKYFQYDNNREYRLKGFLTGRQVYDPNSDKILPEFMLQGYEEINTSPGFLFHPREKKDVYGIPVPPKR